MMNRCFKLSESECRALQDPHIGNANVVGQLTFFYRRTGDLEGVTSFVSVP